MAAVAPVRATLSRLRWTTSAHLCLLRPDTSPSRLKLVRHLSSPPPSKPDETISESTFQSLLEAASKPKPTPTPSPTSAPPPPTPPPQPRAAAPASSTPHAPPSTPTTTQSPPAPSPAARLAALLDTVQARAMTASETLNSLTGYTPIEAVKADNERLETELAELHTRVRTARAAYKSSHARRASTQREVAALLARKDLWDTADLERFTSLYRADHAIEAEVAASAEALADAEAAETSVAARLNQGILKRYHEEQVWSDRIRRASTWGTWGLMGVNILLFIVLQFVAEPWRRKRLVRGVADEMAGGLDQVRAGLAAVQAQLQGQLDEQRAVVVTEAVAPAAAPAVASAPPVPEPAVAWATLLKAHADPRSWPDLARDLASEQPLAAMCMRDASTIALQGAALGATVTSLVAAAAVLAWR